MSFDFANTLIVVFPTVYMISSIINAVFWWPKYMLNSNLLSKVIPNVLMNICVVTPVSLKVIFITNPIHVFCKGFFAEFFELVLNILILEVCFHGFHRLFHLPILYRYHKLHHSVKEVIGVAALYCHWAEMIFVNLSGFIMSHICFSHSFLHLFLIMTFSIINTIFVSHSICNQPNQLRRKQWTLNHYTALLCYA